MPPLRRPIAFREAESGREPTRLNAARRSLSASSVRRTSVRAQQHSRSHGMPASRPISSGGDGLGPKGRHARRHVGQCSPGAVPPGTRDGRGPCRRGRSACPPARRPRGQTRGGKRAIGADRPPVVGEVVPEAVRRRRRRWLRSLVRPGRSGAARTAARPRPSRPASTGRAYPEPPRTPPPRSRPAKCANPAAARAATARGSTSASCRGPGPACRPARISATRAFDTRRGPPRRSGGTSTGGPADPTGAISGFSERIRKRPSNRSGTLSRSPRLHAGSTSSLRGEPLSRCGTSGRG